MRKNLTSRGRKRIEDRNYRKVFALVGGKSDGITLPQDAMRECGIRRGDVVKVNVVANEMIISKLDATE